MLLTNHAFLIVSKFTVKKLFLKEFTFASYKLSQIDTPVIEQKLTCPRIILSILRLLHFWRDVLAEMH